MQNQKRGSQNGNKGGYGAPRTGKGYGPKTVADLCICSSLSRLEYGFKIILTKYDSSWLHRAITELKFGKILKKLSFFNCKVEKY